MNVDCGRRWFWDTSKKEDCRKWIVWKTLLFKDCLTYTPTPQFFLYFLLQEGKVYWGMCQVSDLFFSPQIQKNIYYYSVRLIFSHLLSISCSTFSLFFSYSVQNPFSIYTHTLFILSSSSCVYWNLYKLGCLSICYIIGCLFSPLWNCLK